jgi:hypothetical protein
MKMNKISNVVLFLCLGLILMMIIFVYNLNKRVVSLEKDFLSFKEKAKAIEHTINKENYNYSKNVDFLTDDHFKGFQKVIIDYVKKNINKLVLEKPVLGGRWLATEIKFFSPDIIEVKYEDGHINGVIFLKIDSAFDAKIVLRPFW